MNVVLIVMNIGMASYYIINGCGYEKLVLW